MLYNKLKIDETGGKARKNYQTGFAWEAQRTIMAIVFVAAPESKYL